MGVVLCIIPLDEAALHVDPRVPSRLQGLGFRRRSSMIPTRPHTAPAGKDPAQTEKSILSLSVAYYPVADFLHQSIRALDRFLISRNIQEAEDHKKMDVDVDFWQERLGR